MMRMPFAIVGSCTLLASVAADFPLYGGDDCPCIGIDVSGSKRPFAPIEVKDIISGTEGQFPPELGTTCKAWDSTSTERWCYVDPCNCKKAFSASTYLPTWKYHKKPLHFSFDTCGSSGESYFARVLQHSQAKCSEKEAGIGGPSCPCVGISGRPGHIMRMYAGKEGPYKAEIGSSCSLWENGAYPDCTVDDPSKAPEWCYQTWCYVDPCNCKGIDEAPRPTEKIAGSNIRGRPMYFSFNTCGGNYLLGDGWLETSCWTKTSEAECNAHSNLINQTCGWLEGTGCIDGNLVPLCKAPAQMVTERKVEL